MKTIANYVTILLMSMALKMYAQEFISSPVQFSKEMGENISATGNDYAVIKLNTHTHEFSMGSCLVMAINDTVTGKNEQYNLTLNFAGKFPIDNIDFYDVVNDDNIHTINGELTVNNVTQPYNINFGLHTANASSNIYSQDIRSSVTRISFAIELNAADFELFAIPVTFAKVIVIGVKNGVINKTGDNNTSPECIGAN
ncbi:MAG: hypothetical protein V4608_02525 [Bacteroidota bacterium]